MHLDNNIKVLRKKLGFTQEDVAKELGKTKATISDYEKGRTRPPLNILLQLSELFQINLDDLVTKDLRQEEYTPVKRDTPHQNQELFNRLLVQKLEEVARDLKARDPEAYKRLRLDELIGEGNGGQE